jgi:hypothetical protein
MSIQGLQEAADLLGGAFECFSFAGKGNASFGGISTLSFSSSWGTRVDFFYADGVKI